MELGDRDIPAICAQIAEGDHLHVLLTFAPAKSAKAPRSPGAMKPYSVVLPRPNHWDTTGASCRCPVCNRMRDLAGSGAPHILLLLLLNTHTRKHAHTRARAHTHTQTQATGEHRVVADAPGVAVRPRARTVRGGLGVGGRSHLRGRRVGRKGMPTRGVRGVMMMRRRICHGCVLVWGVGWGGVLACVGGCS